jgi:hypothetical protein
LNTDNSITLDIDAAVKEIQKEALRVQALLQKDLDKLKS